MENPNSWNEIHHLINDAMNKVGPVSEHIVMALSEHKLLIQDTKLVRDLTIYVVEEEYRKYQEELEQGMCGSSFPMRIYYTLVDLGVM